MICVCYRYASRIGNDEWCLQKIVFSNEITFPVNISMDMFIAIMSKYELRKILMSMLNKNVTLLKGMCGMFWCGRDKPIFLYRTNSDGKQLPWHVEIVSSAKISRRYHISTWWCSSTPWQHCLSVSGYGIPQAELRQGFCQAMATTIPTSNVISCNCRVM